MTKNNTETRATLMQRVDHLESWADKTQDHMQILHDSYRSLTSSLNDLRATVRAVDERLAEVQQRLATHRHPRWYDRFRR